jgi:deoxyhypusine synthase
LKEHGNKFFKERIQPIPLSFKTSVSISNFIDNVFFSYNAGRLKEACQLGIQLLSKPDVTIGITLAGALTPAGLGASTIVPLINAGYIDFIISTGANLYHDLHYALDYALYKSHPFHDDIKLRKEGVIRIYDILFSEDVLYNTDAFVRALLQADIFNKTMSTSEFHYLIGKGVDQVEKELKTYNSSILAACYRKNIPVYTSSPGDSTFGLNLASMHLKKKSKCVIDINLDVNETAAFVWNSVSKENGETAVIVVGGGSPKNFYLQTEPYLSEILGLPSRGHDYFIQFTDSRPDTGGLSGATPGEALSWGKIDPDKLLSTVVVYADSTITFPIWSAYLLEKGFKREGKELFKQRDNLVNKMLDESKKYTPPVSEHEIGKRINL